MRKLLLAGVVIAAPLVGWQSANAASVPMTGTDHVATTPSASVQNVVWVWNGYRRVWRVGPRWRHWRGAWIPGHVVPGHWRFGRWIPRHWIPWPLRLIRPCSVPATGRIVSIPPGGYCPGTRLGRRKRWVGERSFWPQRVC